MEHMKRGAHEREYEIFRQNSSSLCLIKLLDQPRTYKLVPVWTVLGQRFTILMHLCLMQ